MSCEGVNCNSRFLPGTTRKRCCKGKTGKPTPQPHVASKDDPGPANLNKPLNKICRPGENILQCAGRTSPIVGGTDDIKDKTTEEKKASGDTGHGGGKGTTNPASGCENCNDGDYICDFMKLGCEIGHGFQSGGEGVLGLSPVIIIGFIAVIMLFQVFR